MRNRNRGSNLGLLLLASQVFQLGLDNIPPVTLATLGLNVYLFLFPLKPILQTCLSVQQTYWYSDWTRLLLSPFHHVDDMHLYFNMVSLLWKGIKLERKLGSVWFTYLLSVFSLLTGLVYLLLEVGLTHITNDSSYSVQCAVGFSGVLFGLKVVNNHYHPGEVTYIMGLPVARHLACWVELILIHIMNPGTSFVGHLAGILVGLLYSTGPLKRLMKSCADIVTFNGLNRGPEPYYYSSGYSGYQAPFPPNFDRGQQYNSAPFRHANNWTTPPQHPYSAGLSEQEQYEAAIRASLNNRGGSEQNRSSQVSQGHFNSFEEEVRWRRLQRFNS